MDNNNTYFILPEPKDKPIKVVIEDSVKVTSNGNVIEIKKHLSSVEAENLLNDIFGTTDIGILDCSDMTEEEIAEIDKIIDEFNKVGCTSFQVTADELKEILEEQNNE